MIFVDTVRRHLPVAIGDPGLIEVFDIDRLERVDGVDTEPGAHTIGLDAERHRVYAFLPLTNRAAVFADDGRSSRSLSSSRARRAIRRLPGEPRPDRR